VSRDRRRFNGATVRRRRISDGRVIRVCGPAGFNGATVRRRRIFAAALEVAGLRDASMGPPSEDGGYSAGDYVAPNVCDSFNGATVRRRRIFAYRAVRRCPDRLELQWGHRPKTADIVEHPRVLVDQPMLQWGHRPKTADISASAYDSWSRSQASMGPPSEDGGYVPAVLMARVGFEPLQWGHRPKTADIFHGAPPAPARRPLQWGHRPKTADIMHEHARVARPGQGASMGPPSEDGGYVLRSRLVEHIATELQWGHRPKTADIAPASSRAARCTRSASMGPPSEDGGYRTL